MSTTCLSNAAGLQSFYLLNMQDPLATCMHCTSTLYGCCPSFWPSDVLHHVHSKPILARNHCALASGTAHCRPPRFGCSRLPHQAQTFVERFNSTSMVWTSFGLDLARRIPETWFASCPHSADSFCRWSAQHSRGSGRTCLCRDTAQYWWHTKQICSTLCPSACCMDLVASEILMLLVFVRMVPARMTSRRILVLTLFCPQSCSLATGDGTMALLCAKGMMLCLTLPPDSRNMLRIPMSKLLQTSSWSNIHLKVMTELTWNSATHTTSSRPTLTQGISGLPRGSMETIRVSDSRLLPCCRALGRAFAWSALCNICGGWGSCGRRSTEGKTNISDRMVCP